MPTNFVDITYNIRDIFKSTSAEIYTPNAKLPKQCAAVAAMACEHR